MVFCKAAYAPLAPAKAVFDFQSKQNALIDPKWKENKI